jgi:hypothetical protein
VLGAAVGTAPSWIEYVYVSGITCTNVCPAVSVIGLPSGPNRSVGAVSAAYDQVP